MMRMVHVSHSQKYIVTEIRFGTCFNGFYLIWCLVRSVTTNRHINVTFTVIFSKNILLPSNYHLLLYWTNDDIFQAIPSMFHCVHTTTIDTRTWIL